jgi:hypothetical protein
MIAMYEKDFEERLDALEKKVEDLSVEMESNKKKQEEEPTLIPGAKYDFVPSVEDEVIARGIGRIVKIEKADSLLGLSDEEWKEFSK